MAVPLHPQGKHSPLAAAAVAAATAAATGDTAVAVKEDVTDTGTPLPALLAGAGDIANNSDLLVGLLRAEAG